ncbi:MAG: hypothetical protein LAT64_09550 [Phycisphaerales bacterium]|nr:hypothetical protein [Planctomycetota bacterium]MCH8508992.1 hypothetical protein [Phycisphaerales bacterium]
MSTTQTSPAPTLSSLAHALLADLDDPHLSELDLCRRHGLTLDQLRAEARRPAFRHAVSIIRELRELRRPLILARAEADAARTLAALTARHPTSATAAKEVRLAVKDLLKLLGAAGFQPVDRPQADALGGAAFQPANRPQADPLASPAPAGEVARRSRDGGGLENPDESRHPQEPPPPPLRSGTSPGSPGEANPTRTPHKPPRKSKYPRGTKPRPKPRSR